MDMTIDPVHIRTGLPSFLLLDAIGEVASDGIAGRRRFSGDPCYLGIEALAQMGAYHVRFLVRFQRQAFLLQIQRCRMPAEPLLDGPALIRGGLTGRSGSTYAYRLDLAIGGRLRMEGNFLFATLPFASSPEGERARTYYERVYACLRSAAGNG